MNIWCDKGHETTRTWQRSPLLLRGDSSHTPITRRRRQQLPGTNIDSLGQSKHYRSQTDTKEGSHTVPLLQSTCEGCNKSASVHRSCSTVWPYGPSLVAASSAPGCCFHPVLQHHNVHLILIKKWLFKLVENRDWRKLSKNANGTILVRITAWQSFRPQCANKWEKEQVAPFYHLFHWQKY